MPAKAIDFAIRLENASKHYSVFDREIDRFKDIVVPGLRKAFGLNPTRYGRKFQALANVSLTVAKGETVGIVGRNGAGKSTLLQLICGILSPSSGTVSVNGRVSTILELGTGFNPDFSGRDNVYLSAAIMGMKSSAIRDRFDQIADFADIGEFIDQPVRTYSSGMLLRLAFAVAINADPDIMIIDEALAVGDESFQRKCFWRLEQLKQSGCTILLVSHSAATIVGLCNRVVLLEGGELLLDGHPKTVVSNYQRLVNLRGEEAEQARREIQKIDGWQAPNTVEDLQPEDRPTIDSIIDASITDEAAAPADDNDEDAWHDPTLVPTSIVEYDSFGARIRDLRITTPLGKQVNVLSVGRRYIYEYVVDFDKSAEHVGFGMLARTIQGYELAGAATALNAEITLQTVDAGQSFRVAFHFNCRLNPGTYFLNAGVTGLAKRSDQREAELGYLHRILDACMFRVAPASKHIATGFFDLEVKPVVEEWTPAD